MSVADGLWFRRLLVWAVFLAGLCDQVATVALSASAASERKRLAVDAILEAPDVQAHIINALQADKVHTRQEVPRSLHLYLTNLSLPVPEEIRDLARRAEESKRVSPEDADHALQTLNKMMEQQSIVLDHKVIDCRERRRSAGEAIQDALEEVRSLASVTSSARGVIVDAASRIPQDHRSFEAFKAEAEVSRSRCKSAGLSDKVKAKSLEKDAWMVGAIRDALVRQCQKTGGSFVQADGCPALAESLGVVARKHGAHSAAFLLQKIQPADCKFSAHNCAAMKDVASEVLGEIADSQARLRANSARNREACQDEELFSKNQLAMETSQASDRSKELAEATLKAGQAGDQANEKDNQRQKLQAELKALTAKCNAEISDILYGKMCALQKVRDSLQIAAGRTELPEDCQVTDWDEGICSTTCGGGMKKLTRKVLLSPKGGAACPPLTLMLKCGETACPKDCDVSQWSGWSACSAPCAGGIQERNRVVTSKPHGNGVACPHLTDMQMCNTEACTSDCELLQWTPWSTCSKACDGGMKKRSRGLRDEGKASCPTAQSKDRLEFQECNTQKCGEDNNVVCAGTPLDIALLVDASGSMTKEGFDAVKTLSLELIRHYSLSDSMTKLGVAAFSKEATVVSALSDDIDEVTRKISNDLQWLSGPSNAGAGLSRAASLLALGGRKTASSLVLVITDGRFVDPFLARQAADKMKENGVRLVFALVGTEYKNNGLLESMASLPGSDNIIPIPDFKELPAYGKWAVKRIIGSTCSQVEKP